VRVPQIDDHFIDGSYDAAVHYTTITGGALSALASRGVVTNVFVGDVLLQTGVGLRATHFFGRNQAWQLVGGLDYQVAESVFVVDVDAGGIKVFSGAASLNYQWTRHLLLELEANYTYQDAEASIRNAMLMPANTLHRTMAVLSLAYVFPEPDTIKGGGGGRRRARATTGEGGAEARTGIDTGMDPGRAERAEPGGPKPTVTRQRREGHGPTLPGADPSR
jgi:hypothetical protein